MLQVSGLQVAYGDVQALWGIDFEVPAGRIVALLGANGAGKTTTLRTISGLIRPRAGRVHFDGQDLGQPRAARDRRRSASRTSPRAAASGRA